MTIATTKRPTIIDVARKAKVSPATVSMVFNDSCPISAPVRERVFASAKLLGYRKSPAGRPPILNQAASNEDIALILFCNKTWQNAAHSSLYQYVYDGLYDEFSRNGVELIWQNADLRHCPKQSAYIAYIPSSIGEAMLTKCTLPTVRMMGGIDSNLHIDQVSYDNDMIGPIAAKWVIAKGLRRVAAIGNCSNPLSQRTKTFAELCRQNGVEVCEKFLPLAFGLEHDIRLLNQTFGEILTDFGMPELIFVYSDTITMLLYKVLTMREIEPMRDLLIISVDNSPLIKLLDHQPIEIDLMSYDVGEQTARLLLSRHNKKNYSPIQIKIEPKIIEPEK